MKILSFILILLSAFMVQDHAVHNPAINAITLHSDTSSIFTGNFTDDYGIKYTITDTLWIQQPRTRFHIIKWNKKEQYLIARNDVKNPGEGGLYTRIDFMQFNGMAPWLWGYCITVYDAKSDAAAEAVAIADRKNPRKGCNGYPFSRMKRVE